jgi:hypothetical protein
MLLLFALLKGESLQNPQEKLLLLWVAPMFCLSSVLAFYTNSHSRLTCFP